MNETDLNISVMDLLDRDKDKLTEEELITVIQFNKPDLDISSYDYDKLEKIFILAAWENQVENINTKQYSIMRLKNIFLFMKKYDLKNVGENKICMFCSMAITILFFYVIRSIGFFTFIHEIFGHLYLGGGLLSYPVSRYSFTYPNEYYGVKRFDQFIQMDKTFENYMKFILGYEFKNVTTLDSSISGIAYPYKNREGYTDIYHLWGKLQSDGFMYLSGMLPNYTLGIIFGIIGIIHSLIFDNDNSIYILMVSMDLYIYQLISLFNVIHAEYEEYTADIKAWSICMNKYTNKYSVSSYEYQTIFVLVFLYPYCILTIGLYLHNKFKKFLHKKTVFNIVIRNVEYEQFVYEKMLSIPNKTWKLYLDEFIKRPESDIVFNKLNKELYNRFTNEDVLQIYQAPYILGFDDYWLLAYEAVKVSLFLAILFIPITNAFTYRTSHEIDTVKFLPSFLTTILLLETLYNFYSGEISKKYKVDTFFQVMLLVVAMYLSVLYYENYRFFELSFIWGDIYLVSIFFCYSISNYINYRKKSRYFRNMIINEVAEDT